MEMRLLEYVVEIYRKQSFTKAAASLCIAQPSLSQQISKLEGRLGLKLFNRGHGAVTPTPDGLRFVRQAEKILSMRDDLEREMQERSEGIGKDLVIGTTAITGGHILPPLLQAYGRAYPQVRVRLVEESTEKLTDLTARGLVDLSILSLPVADTRLATRKMWTEQLFLALPRIKYEWMPKEVQQLVDASPREPENLEPIPLALLSKAPFILLKKGFGFRQTVLELCAKNGFQPEIAFETSSIETAQSLVTYGLGVTLIPHLVAAEHKHNSSPLYIMLESRPTRTLVFTYPRERYLSLAAQALFDIFDQVFY